MIYCDVDGVLRILDVMALGRPAKSWDDVNDNGKNVFQIVNDNPDLCLIAPCSEYLPVINEMFSNKKLCILTSQPKPWRKYTEMWLQTHLNINYEVIYTKNPSNKLRYLEYGDWLIDDNPNFDNFDQILLIDRIYNRHVNTKYRIKTPIELWQTLNNILYNGK